MVEVGPLSSLRGYHDLVNKLTVLLLCSTAVVLYSGTCRIRAQSIGEGIHDPALSDGAVQNNASTPIFRLTTHEVLIDVIALQGQNQPALNLKPEDIQVSESFVAADADATGRNHKLQKGSHTEREAISSLLVVKPEEDRSEDDEGRRGFQIAASCLERSTIHYQLAFRPGPNGLRSGYHHIAITTTRPRVKLLYRHEYYVGLMVPPVKPPVFPADKLLYQASCYYPATPPTISLQAKPIDSGRTDVLHYRVAVDANSLSFLTLDTGAVRSNAGVENRVQLDYGICNFDGRGRPISFFYAPLEGILSSAEYARALDRGFSQIVQFPKPEHVALMRVVVRDRPTGNLGAIDIPYPEPSEAQTGDSRQPNDSALLTTATKANLEAIGQSGDMLQELSASRPQLRVPLLQGPVGSFGSIISNVGSFCGDVYELPQQAENLPDFREFDPIGSLYTPVLDVPNQRFSNTTGIPGVTPRTNLFGIDYHSVMWAARAGRYEFQMISDDGAVLRIDDKTVIDLDGLHRAVAGKGRIQLDAGPHTMEVRYYQGACCDVALILWVKPPDVNSWTLFNTNDYGNSVLDSGSSAGSMAH